ncbi:MAG: UDP-N-acetylglucosamine 1-carboxyvinyltransferase, partial [Patescibacteria group bacterium]
MSKLCVVGGKKLKGEVKVAGNKNSALKLMAAALLAGSPSTFTNVPRIADVKIMGELIKKLGAKVDGLGTTTLTINPSTLSSYELDPELTGRIRASVVLAAPLLAKFGKAVITPPGGDQIGERLLTTHFSMMREFGVNIKRKGNKFLLEWKVKKAPDIFLEEASVTATEMALMLSATLGKIVRVDDAACEPHVADLINYLSAAGVNIRGVGTNSLFVTGNKRIRGVKFKVSPDHVEVGTFAIASAITGGNVIINGAVREHTHMLLHYLESMGVKYKFVGQDKL